MALTMCKTVRRAPATKPKTTRANKTVSTRGASMADTVRHSRAESDHGHTGAVDDRLAKSYGGRASTWHSRRFGPHAVNHLAACIIREWRAAGDLAELAEWVRPIEAALAHLTRPGASARLRSALADAAEDEAEARFIENPCAETARELLRKRAADRLASLDHDREIASRYDIEL
jgi:hypothetical protein